MKCAIVGAGAVGLYYGAKLARAGHEVHFLVRSDYEGIRAGGIVIESEVEPGFTVRPVHVHREAARVGPAQTVIVTLKATQNDALPDILPHLSGPGTVFLTLQNGLGHEELLATLCGDPDRVCGGMCFVCLNREGPGRVRHLGFGLITLGAFAPGGEGRARELKEACAAAGIETQFLERLGEARWRKLVWNIPFNGLTIACGGLDVGAMVEDPLLSELAEAVMAEVIGGARAVGHIIDPEFAAEQMAKTRRMGAYQPSSLIDWKAGRAIEVEAIWGEPWRRARRAGYDMARVGMLYAMLGGRTRAL